MLSQVDIFPTKKHYFLILQLLVKQINKNVQQKCQKSIFFYHLRYNDYLPLDAAQWVAEVQCEPECIIRNIIDNTFYNKNVVVSNPLTARSLYREDKSDRFQGFFRLLSPESDNRC